MENLIIKGSDKTPLIEFFTNGYLRIEGRSISENPVKLYDEASTWLDDYLKTCPRKTEIHINLEYLNSSSSKNLAKLLKKLEQISREGLEVQVHWYSGIDDDGIKEAGEIYEKMVEIPFHHHELA